MHLHSIWVAPAEGFSSFIGDRKHHELTSLSHSLFLFPSLSLSMADQNLVAVKIGFNGDLHRLRVDLNSFTLATLSQLFGQTFRLAPGSFVIKYTDAEGDTLNVCSDAEFVEACRVFLSGNHDELKALKFTAVARDGAAPAHAADPLLQAVERLVVTLNTTVDKVREEEWTGVDAATEALSQAASDAKSTLEAARAAVQEKPLEAVVEETSDGLKSAASGISSFAQRLVKSFITDKKPEAAVVAPPPPPPPSAPQTEEPEEKVEAAPAAEVQQEAAPPLTPVEPEVVVAAAPAPSASEVAFSEAEIKWAEQLMMVRGIFPDVDTANAIQLLETHKGDVNVVINELMEELM
jgi:hypothetical protein